jgi:predicted phage terminase large subunit-like protein
VESVSRIRIVPPALHAAQQEVLSSQARLKILACGRRWGKTFLGCVLGLFGAPNGWLGAVTGGRVWWVAPTYHAAMIAYDMAVRLVRQVNQTVPLGTVVKSLRLIEFAETGGVFAFRSSDQPDNLRGESLDGLVMDEADFQPEGVYRDVLRPMLVDRRGWALLISTPNPRNIGGWLHRLAGAVEAGEVQDAAFYRFPTETNPYIPREEIVQARRDIGDVSFRREFEAEWVSNEAALVKPEWWQEAPVLETGRVALGVDLAISRKSTADYTALVAVMKVERGWHVIHAERFRAGFHEALKRIERAAERLGAETVAVEAVAYQAAMVQELLRQTSLPVKPVKPSADKVTRFTPVAARFEAGQVYVAPGLPHDFREEVLAFPFGEHDDYCDALVYAVQAVGRERYDWVAAL